MLPLPELVLRYVKPAQETVGACVRRNRRAMLQRRRPVTARRKFRLQHGRRAGPERRDERPRKSDDVKQRQMHLIYIVWPQALLQRADHAAPQDICVCPQHRFRPGDRAGGEQDHCGRGWVGCAAGQRLAVKRGEQFPDFVGVAAASGVSPASVCDTAIQSSVGQCSAMRA